MNYSNKDKRRPGLHLEWDQRSTACRPLVREVCETNVRKRVNIGVRYSIWLEDRGAWVEQNIVAYSSVTLTRGKWARTTAKQIAKDWRRSGFKTKLVKITTWRIFLA